MKKIFFFIMIFVMTIFISIDAYADRNIEHLIGKLVIVVPLTFGNSCTKGTIGTLKEVKRIDKRTTRWHMIDESYIIIQPLGSRIMKFIC